MSKSKFFRVATEGATTDGRAISREWITQMASSYSRTKYGARIWMEHIRGISPDSTFKAYGDVLAVEAREVEDGKLGLFAQIEPLPALVDLIKSGQKIYTSIEVAPKFADSNTAYLTGLAITDSPASLGTEVLTFAAQKPEASPFKARHSQPDALFTEAVAVTIDLSEPDDLSARFSDKLKSLVEKFKGRSSSDDVRFNQVSETLEGLADAFNERIDKLVQAAHFAELKAAHDKMQADFNALQAKLDATPGQQHSQRRPPATGGTTRVQTDC